jgi:AcrR family transcriptional regulator
MGSATKTQTGHNRQGFASDIMVQRPDGAASAKLRRTYAERGTDPRQIRSANALREAMLRLLERKDFDQITVREITVEAGVHNATFFRHYADKESLLDKVAAEEIKRLVAFSLPAGLSLEGNLALCRYVHDHRTLWKALLNGGARLAMREEYLRLSMEVASRHTGTKSWLPEELAVTCSTMLITETISWWLAQEKGAYSAEQVARMLYQLIDNVSAGATPDLR